MMGAPSWAVTCADLMRWGRKSPVKGVRRVGSAAVPRMIIWSYTQLLPATGFRARSGCWALPIRILERADRQSAACAPRGGPRLHLWAHTLRFVGQPRSQNADRHASILTEPWKISCRPASNWLYDQMIIRETAADPTLPDPFTGLFLPPSH